jgi:hypothetical protein
MYNHTVRGSGREKLMRRTVLVVLLLSSLLLAGCIAAFCEESKIRFAHAVLVQEVANRSVEGDATISICAAKGEYEPFLIIVENEGEVPRLDFSELAGPGKIDKSAFEYYIVQNTSCEIPKDPKLGRKRNFNKRTTETVTRSFPDILVAPKSTEKADGRVIFWVTLKVPYDAKPGLYTSTVEVKKEKKNETAKFSLEVWNFSLPKSMTFRLSAGTPRGTRLLPDAEALKRCEENFAAHHVSCRGARNPKIAFKDGKPVVDWSEYDKEMTYLIDTLGMNYFQFPFTYVVWGHGGHYVETFGKFSRGEISEEFKKNFSVAVKEAVKHLKEKNWLDRFFVNFSDEPYENQYEETRILAKLIQEADPDLKPGCYGPLPNKELLGFVEHWITHPYPLDPNWQDGFKRTLGAEKIKEVRNLLTEETKKGNLWSVYNPHEDYALAAAPVEQRTFYWWCFKEDISSAMQWTVCDARRQPALNRDWDSIWVYVDSDKSIINTVRWEMTREGIEDYEYLHLIQKKKGDSEAKKICSQLVRAITDRTLEPQKLIELRCQMGNILSQE